jgi:hypothetical protein
MERMEIMQKPEEIKHYPFDKPGTYRIRFLGRLNESLFDRLGGMHVEESSRGEQGLKTTLVGRIRDQAELIGVVNTLYELHLTLLSVEYQDE